MLLDKPLVSIQHLNHYFGQDALRRQVLHNIQLEIMPGEILILSGPSGSGKTTLLTLIGALRTVHEGSLNVLGQELRDASEDLQTQMRCQIGYIFQHYNLLPFLTAEQNVRVPLENYPNLNSSQLEARAKQALADVGLEEFCSYYPSKLSGGQKQRVSIARALVTQPKLILADEPTAALDSQSGRDVVNLMRQRAQEQDCTIVIVTHDNRILDVGDRRLHMEDGFLMPEVTQRATFNVLKS